MKNMCYANTKSENSGDIWPWELFNISASPDTPCVKNTDWSLSKGYEGESISDRQGSDSVNLCSYRKQFKYNLQQVIYSRRKTT